MKPGGTVLVTEVEDAVLVGSRETVGVIGVAMVTVDELAGAEDVVLD